MPAALPMEIRQEIVERRQNGESFQAIADEMGQSYYTVRAIWRHWQEYKTLKPNYEACKHEGPRKGKACYERAIEMKRLHPRWGAQVIRLKLEEEYEGGELPGVRTLQTWFRKAGVNRSAVTKQQKEKVKRGQEAHEVWAVDAKEKMKLADGSGASWLTITDEASSAILHAEAFPPKVLDTDRTGTSQSRTASSLREMGETRENAF